jgi:hypothetical protein
LLDYVCKLLKTYPGLSRDEVWWELPMDQGWAMYYWAMENDPWLQFNGVRRADNGYVGQEINRLVRIALEYFGLNNGKANGRTSITAGEHSRVQPPSDGGA